MKRRIRGLVAPRGGGGSSEHYVAHRKPMAGGAMPYSGATTTKRSFHHAPCKIDGRSTDAAAERARGANRGKTRASPRTFPVLAAQPRTLRPGRGARLLCALRLLAVGEAARVQHPHHRALLGRAAFVERAHRQGHR